MKSIVVRTEPFIPHAPFVGESIHAAMPYVNLVTEAGLPGYETTQYLVCDFDLPRDSAMLRLGWLVTVKPVLFERYGLRRCGAQSVLLLIEQETGPVDTSFTPLPEMERFSQAALSGTAVIPRAEALFTARAFLGNRDLTSFFQGPDTSPENRIGLHASFADYSVLCDKFISLSSR